MNYWTQELPRVSGYYWFAYEWGQDAKIQWIEVDDEDRQYVAVWDYSEDGEVCLLIADGYYYSAYPIITLPWEN